MREIGEQWIEEIDGVRHMVKAVEGESCKGCTFGMMRKGSGLNDIHVCDREDDCPLEYSNTVVKDLGILNEDGCLACPFCGAFPIVRCIEEQEGECIVAQAFCPKGDLEIQEPEGKGHVLWFMRTTLQQAIDAWNRRA